MGPKLLGDITFGCSVPRSSFRSLRSGGVVSYLLIQRVAELSIGRWRTSTRELMVYTSLVAVLCALVEFVRRMHQRGNGGWHSHQFRRLIHVCHGQKFDKLDLARQSDLTSNCSPYGFIAGAIFGLLLSVIMLVSMFEQDTGFFAPVFLLGLAALFTGGVGLCGLRGGVVG